MKTLILIMFNSSKGRYITFKVSRAIGLIYVLELLLVITEVHSTPVIF
jgi:hypothetical protein